MILRKIALTHLLLIFLPVYLLAQEFGGNPGNLRWMQINNPHTRVIFPAGMDSQANRINNINQLLGNSTATSIGNKQKKWDILLLNQTTIPNAYVRMAPVMSELYMTPGQNNFNTGSLRWDDNLIIHENRHIQQLSNFNTGLTKLFSFFLGEEGQLLANGLAIPDYFFEGDAVWQETLVSAQGRGRMPFFYNGIKSLWLEDKQYSWMKLRSGSYRDYTPSHYDLGYQLITYGYEKYGEDFWKKVTGDAVSFKGLFYSFNKAIERYSGVRYSQFRQDALLYFKERSIPAGESKAPPPRMITRKEAGNVTDYLFPVYLNDDSILVTRRSNKSINGFYVLAGGREQLIRVKDAVLDDYFSYRNGKIVYAAYRSDPRRGNRNFSVLQLLDIYSKQQRQLTFRSKYFSPDISMDGSEVLAVQVNTDGTNYLHRINALNGSLIKALPNPQNYFFTQTKYLDPYSAVSAVRTSEGKMALVKVDLNTGESENLTPFSFNVLGYPFIKGDTVYFGAMNKHADKVFALSLGDKKLFQLTHNPNGVYQPVVNGRGDLLYSAFTADGYMLATTPLAATPWERVKEENFSQTPDLYTEKSFGNTGSGILYQLSDTVNTITPYKKSLHLLNFHSRRPEVNDPEYSYHFYSDNVLSTFSNSLSYTFNRAERSHTLGFYESFAGWFPIFRLGGEHSFNRRADTAAGKPVHFNSAKLNAGLYVPLSFIGGRTAKYVSLGGGYNLEQRYYRGIGKNAFTNRSIKYINSFLSFSNVNRKAKQHIFPHWAQSISLSYRDALTILNSHKFVGNSSFYFPGLFTNHSLVLNASFQKRDTLPDFFSNTFSYSRGYEALSTRRMYKWGANYHFPIAYPDWGVGNILFFQRIRANTFYDHTIAHARVNGKLTDIKNRSTGAELYFDTKAWNSLSVTFGVRFSHLLDTDLRNPGLRNYWEFIVPIGLIPD